jgi:hypothetical protein
MSISGTTLEGYSANLYLELSGQLIQSFVKLNAIIQPRSFEIKYLSTRI